MKNSFLYFIKSKIYINVSGKNIERFIKRLRFNNIDILNIKYISNNEINIIIYKKDYDKLIELKTVYDVTILNYNGYIKYKNNILNNKYIILFILLFLTVIYFLSNLIFNIEIITNDSNMKVVLERELNKLGIKKYNFKKSYIDLEKIKHEILNKHKNDIEWIEIENIGTKYIIKYEPRIINKENTESDIRNIVASKDAVITNMNISRGQIIKGVNSYVKKGDVIVSGDVKLNDSSKDKVRCEGVVYGETWYKVEITYPFKYHEIKETGNTRTVLVIKFINKEIELFTFKKYKTKKVKNEVIIKNTILPIGIMRQRQIETIEINENYGEVELIEKAIDYSKEKLLSNNEKAEIKDYKVLDKSVYQDSIKLSIFFTVIEDITEYQSITYDEIIE